MYQPAHLSTASKPIQSRVDAESNFRFRCYRNPKLAKSVASQPWLFIVMGSSGGTARRPRLWPALASQMAAGDRAVDTAEEIGPEPHPE